MAKAAQGLDIPVEDVSRIRISRHGAVDARLAQKVQRRVRRTVGVVVYQAVEFRPNMTISIRFEAAARLPNA